uniref:Uncharacterized protein n=1 Tax=Siphoviridae sp. ct5co22 TaxID=2826294 RepID=A0A8S5QVE2_9CAUD|nr:MAG TPA: hypothetical protein [Siphoviridae sp. ct5co22]
MLGNCWEGFQRKSLRHKGLKEIFFHFLFMLLGN